MKNYLKFTEKDKLVINSYNMMLDGLSEFLGDGHEILLHSLEDLDESAVKVINGHLSGRREGAPITDLAMEMLSKFLKNDESKCGKVYYNRSSKGVPLRSATLPIFGENNRIIGLICINFYMDIPLHSYLDSLMKFKNENNNVVETFVTNSDELISSTILKAKNAVINDASVTASNKNKEIIRYLFERDIFDLKDSVVKVAKLLSISKNTVYMHIRNFAQ